MDLSSGVISFVGCRAASFWNVHSVGGAEGTASIALTMSAHAPIGARSVKVSPMPSKKACESGFLILLLVPSGMGQFGFPWANQSVLASPLASIFARCRIASTKSVSFFGLWQRRRGRPIRKANRGSDVRSSRKLLSAMVNIGAIAAAVALPKSSCDWLPTWWSVLSVTDTVLKKPRIVDKGSCAGLVVGCCTSLSSVMDPLLSVRSFGSGCDGCEELCDVCGVSCWLDGVEASTVLGCACDVSGEMPVIVDVLLALAVASVIAAWRAGDIGGAGRPLAVAFNAASRALLMCDWMCPPLGLKDRTFRQIGQR